MNVDIVHRNEASGSVEWVVIATVTLVGGKPALSHVELWGDPELRPEHLQRHFRWRTPLDIVSLLIPKLLARGIDPYSHDFAIDGYPNAAMIDTPANQRLSDDFLREIAAQYQSIGRGYASILASQRGVSRRTVVSWIEKARRRGILEKTRSGTPTY